MDPYETLTIGEAHRFARLAEEAAALGNWQQAIDKHSRAANHFAACLQLTANADAQEVLRGLQASHLRRVALIRTRLGLGPAEAPPPAVRPAAPAPAEPRPKPPPPRPSLQELMDSAYKRLLASFDRFKEELRRIKSIREQMQQACDQAEAAPSAVPELRGDEDAAALRAAVETLKRENLQLRHDMRKARSAVKDALLTAEDLDAAFQARAGEFYLSLQSSLHVRLSEKDGGAAATDPALASAQAAVSKAKFDEELAALERRFSEAKRQAEAEAELRRRQAALVADYEKKLQRIKREREAGRRPPQPLGTAPQPAAAAAAGPARLQPPPSSSQR